MWFEIGTKFFQGFKRRPEEKGRGAIFSTTQKGGNFLHRARGGQKKIDDPRSHTNAPIPVKMIAPPNIDLALMQRIEDNF